MLLKVHLFILVKTFNSSSLCVLQSIVLYRLAFLKIILPKGKFPKQGICTNHSFSLVQYLQRNAFRLSHIVEEPWSNLLFSVAPLRVFLRSFLSSWAFHVFVSFPSFPYTLTNLGNWVFIFSCPVILSMGAQYVERF